MVIALMMIGFYTVIAHHNLVKKLPGFQCVPDLGVHPVNQHGQDSRHHRPHSPRRPQGDNAVYAHPLPQVLILTAIVVDVSTSALGLALIARIHEAYGSIAEDEILAADFATQDVEQAQDAERLRAAKAAEPHAPPGGGNGAESGPR